MNEKHFKVIFVGDLQVGKTSFIIKFTQNKFSPNYKATFGSKALSRVRTEWLDQALQTFYLLLLICFCSGLHYNRS